MPFISPNPEDRRPSPPEQLEIDTGMGKRIFGWVGHIVLILLVAGTFVALFIQFTGSIRMAIGLVGFMLIYMMIMGTWASRNHDNRDE